MRFTSRIYTIFAVSWTVAIILASLISISKAPEIPIKNLDKLVHATFYFGFVALWVLAKPKKQRGLVLISAVLLGGLLELAQGAMHQHRSADWYDFMANTVGAFLAFLLINKIILFLKHFHLYNS